MFVVWFIEFLDWSCMWKNVFGGVGISWGNFKVCLNFFLNLLNVYGFLKVI